VPFLGIDVESIDWSLTGNTPVMELGKVGEKILDGVVVNVVCCLAAILAVENILALAALPVWNFGSDLDAMNAEVSGVSFDSFLLLTMKDDVGLLPKLFANFETLTVDLGLVVKNPFGSLGEKIFDLDFGLNTDDLPRPFDEKPEVLATCFFLEGWNLVNLEGPAKPGILLVVPLVVLGPTV